MVNVILVLILLGITYLCIRYIHREHKRGRCVGCSAGCCDCSHCAAYAENLKKLKAVK